MVILSKIYRLWASIRLRHTQAWTDSWRTEDLYAGTGQPTGAEDAWNLFSMFTEEALVAGNEVSGGSSDIVKCFDQIQLDLLLDLLALSGFPTQPLQAYRSFHQGLLFHNTIVGGLGEPHLHPCAIPQGCPYSMTMVSFLLAPWFKQMRAMHFTPRCLTDDLLIIAYGEGYLQRTIEAYAQTFSYLHCLGAAVSAKKSYTFCSTARGRNELRCKYGVPIAARVTCLTSTRGLGGQLNVGKCMAATSTVLGWY